jgi:type IV secretion system protein VirB5
LIKNINSIITAQLGGFFYGVFIMKILKNTCISFSILCAAVSTSYAQGIPTIDATAIAKYVEQIAQMKTQIENQVSQITELKNQVTALTSVDGLKNAAKDLTLDNVPAEWQDIYKDIDALSQADIDSLLSHKNYEANNSQKILVNYTNSLEKAFTETTERFNRLNSLQSRLQTAKNVKEAADIQNQIATESAAIAVAQTQLDNIHRAYEVQKEIHAEQALRDDYCSSMRTRGRNPAECQ